MTELQPAHYTQGACHTAQGDRQVLQSLVCTEGVALDNGGGLAVTTAGSGLGVIVASGAGFVLGDSAATQGMYHVYNDGNVTKTLGAADPTDDRIDLIVALVNDAVYAGALDTWAITVVAGTAAPAPVAPALPSNAIPLAEVLVTAGLTGPIPSGNITDLRATYELCAANVRDQTTFKPANEYLTSTTALQDDDDLFFTVEAGESYIIEGGLFFQQDTPTSEVKVAFNGPTLTTLIWTLDGGTESAYDAVLNNGGAGGNPISGFIQCSADGVVHLRFAQDVSDPAGTGLKKGSWLRATRL